MNRKIFNRLLPAIMLLGCLPIGGLFAASPAELRSFLKTHCIDCHQGEDAEGNLDLAAVGDDLADRETLRRWTAIHDRLAAGEMPPQDADPPPDKQRAAAVAGLRVALLGADRQRASVVLRRLNRIEYENTVRDLFGVRVSVKELLPRDNSSDGFDNVGEGLDVSAEAAAAYLRAADATLDAVFGPAKKPRYIKHETNLLRLTNYDGTPRLAKQIGAMFSEDRERTGDLSVQLLSHQLG